jgi:hypothetical protein
MYPAQIIFTEKNEEEFTRAFHIVQSLECPGCGIPHFDIASTLKMETVFSSETMVTIYNTTRCHNKEDQCMNSYHRENFNVLSEEEH